VRFTPLRCSGACVSQRGDAMVVSKNTLVHRSRCTKFLCIAHDAQSWYKFYAVSTGNCIIIFCQRNAMVSDPLPNVPCLSPSCSISPIAVSLMKFNIISLPLSTCVIFDSLHVAYCRCHNNQPISCLFGHEPHLQGHSIHSFASINCN